MAHIDFDNWIKNPDKNRVMLAELKYHDGASEKTRYLSTKSRGDFGHYDASIHNVPILRKSMSQSFGKAALPATGFLDVNNADGRFDSWISDAWTGRDATFFLGDASWDKVDFDIRFSGKVERLEIVNDAVLRFHVRDKQHLLDKPIQESVYGAGDSKGEIIPLCFGVVKNITPVLTNSTTHEYQIHDGAVTDACTQLYVNGATSSVTVTKVNSTGKFTLASDPNGTVTIDAIGANYTKPGALIREIVTTYGGLTDPDDLNTDDFTAYDVGAPTISLYVRERNNILDVLDTIVSSHLGYYYFCKDGLFAIRKLKDPLLATSDLSLGETDTLDKIGYTLDKSPRWKTTIGYDKNWTVQTNIDTGEGEISFRATSHSEKVYEDTNKATIKAKYLDAQAPGVENTLIISETDAATEAEFRQDMFGVHRHRVKIKVFSSAYLLCLGSVFELSDHRFNLDTQKILVTSMDENIVDNIITVGGWF